MPNTLIYERLESQHTEVSDLIAQMKETTTDQVEERRNLVGELRIKVLAHAHAEQDEVYPRFRQVSSDARDEVKDDLEEHTEIEQRLEALCQSSPEDDSWLKKLESLEECIDHHVDDEENELFPEVKQHLSDKDARSICRSFDEAFERHKSRLESHNGDLDEMTRDELYELAQEHNIEGRSDMKKDELIYALRH